ncbi:MAG: MATE family efflux transporter [Clostridia bacterium]|nr:MATE family efflux transporter [Clostridia bacterium]
MGTATQRTRTSLLTRFQAFFDAQDMTEGKPLKNLILFSIPLLIGNFAQQLYSTVDSIVVGRYVGDNALAAIGAAFPLLNLVLVLFIAISTGAGIIVSQYFGAKDREQLSRAVGNATVLLLIVGIATTAIGLAVTRPMLRLMGTPEVLYDMSSTYLLILFCGTITMAYYNIVSGILRGMGDSVTPLLYLLVACGLNIVLDIWFVAHIGWGVAGVAVATVISQAVSAVLCVRRLFRMRESLDISAKTLRLSAEHTKSLVRVGLPSGITQAVFSMAMVITQSLTNSLGPIAVACSVVVMRVDGFAMLPNFTFGMAIATFVGQNIGANRMDRVKSGSRTAAIVSMSAALVLTTAILLFARTMFGWFTQTEMLKDLGVRAIRTLAFGYLAMGVMQVYSGIMRGAGDTVTPMWISLITSVVLRVPVAYLWAWLSRSPEWPNGSPDCLYFSLLIVWCVGALLNYVYYRKGDWQTKSVVGVRRELDKLAP